MRWRSGGRIWVRSCGLDPLAVDGFALSSLEELGLTAGFDHGRTFADLEDTSFDLVVSLSPEAHHWAVDLVHEYDMTPLYWPSYDPSIVTGARAQRLDAYRQTRDHIDGLIRQNLPEWRPEIAWPWK